MNSESGVSCCRHPLGDGVVTVFVLHRYPEVSVLESATGSGGTVEVASRPNTVPPRPRRHRRAHRFMTSWQCPKIVSILRSQRYTLPMTECALETQRADLTMQSLSRLTCSFRPLSRDDARLSVGYSLLHANTIREHGPSSRGVEVRRRGVSTVTLDAPFSRRKLPGGWSYGKRVEVPLEYMGTNDSASVPKVTEALRIVLPTVPAWAIGKTNSHRLQRSPDYVEVTA